MEVAQKRKGGKEIKAKESYNHPEAERSAPPIQISFTDSGFPSESDSHCTRYFISGTTPVLFTHRSLPIIVVIVSAIINKTIKYKILLKLSVQTTTMT